MLKNFVTNCDLCGGEIPLGEHARRNISVDSVELLMIALENSDPDLEFVQNDDGTVGVDTCLECYSRVAFSNSQIVN